MTPPLDALLLVKMQLKILNDKLGMEYVALSFAFCKSSQAKKTPPILDAILLSKTLPIVMSEDCKAYMTPLSPLALLPTNVLVIIIAKDPTSKNMTPDPPGPSLIESDAP